jgi:hypothetical protein
MKSGPAVAVELITAPKKNDSAGLDAPCMNAQRHADAKRMSSRRVQKTYKAAKFSFFLGGFDLRVDGNSLLLPTCAILSRSSVLVITKNFVYREKPI